MRRRSGTRVVDHLVRADGSVQTPPPGSRAWVAELMLHVFEECQELRDAGQAEYARRDENALANFERVAEALKIPREKVLLVYLEKHLDGIRSWVDGHRSQREPVAGRINDAIVYLVLLRAMAEQLGATP